jgi:hypothetical protein
MVFMVLRTVNNSIATTTLHLCMNIHVKCMMANKNFNVSFISDYNELHKSLKSAGDDRMIFIDYGVSCNIDPLLDEKNKITLVKGVGSEIDWNMFRKKTLEKSSEPVQQRGLKFDEKPKAFSVDPKFVLKKMEGKTLDFTKMKGVIVNLDNDVLCHHVYECKGNIMETLGTKMEV